MKVKEVKQSSKTKMGVTGEASLRARKSGKGSLVRQ